MSERELAVEYFVKSLSTGERTAAQRLERRLAEDVEFETNTQPGAVPIGRETLKGRDAVLNQVFGLWPATPGYARMGWSDPIAEGDQLRVVTSGSVTLEFSFNAADEIQRVVLEGGYGSGAAAPAQQTGKVDELPLVVKGLINNALANQAPIIVTYVDDKGIPHTSLRGSVCVLSSTEVAIWVRHGDGGLPQAVTKNPYVTVFYSDRRANTVVNITGRASIADDAETRRKVFELSPEVEQTHDPDRHGVPLVIEILRLQANTGGGRGAFSMDRTSA